jgi:hypothetical protein
VKANDLKARLGEPETFPSVEEVKANISKRMTNALQDYIRETEEQMQTKLKPLLRRKNELKSIYREERKILRDFQEERWHQETIARVEQLPKGLRGIWYRVTGQYQKTRQQNERETELCCIRDRDEMQALIDRQLEQRQKLQAEINKFKQHYQIQHLELKRNIAHYMDAGGMLSSQNTRNFNAYTERVYAPEL